MNGEFASVFQNLSTFRPVNTAVTTLTNPTDEELMQTLESLACMKLDVGPPELLFDQWFSLFISCFSLVKEEEIDLKTVLCLLFCAKKIMEGPCRPDYIDRLTSVFENRGERRFGLERTFGAPIRFEDDPNISKSLMFANFAQNLGRVSFRRNDVLKWGLFFAASHLNRRDSRMMLRHARGDWSISSRDKASMYMAISIVRYLYTELFKPTIRMSESHQAKLAAIFNFEHRVSFEVFAKTMSSLSLLEVSIDTSTVLRNLSKMSCELAIALGLLNKQFAQTNEREMRQILDGKSDGVLTRARMLLVTAFAVVTRNNAFDGLFDEVLTNPKDDGLKKVIQTEVMCTSMITLKIQASKDGSVRDARYLVDKGVDLSLLDESAPLHQLIKVILTKTRFECGEANVFTQIELYWRWKEKETLDKQVFDSLLKQCHDIFREQVLAWAHGSMEVAELILAGLKPLTKVPEYVCPNVTSELVHDEQSKWAVAANIVWLCCMMTPNVEVSELLLDFLTCSVTKRQFVVNLGIEVEQGRVQGAMKDHFCKAMTNKGAADVAKMLRYGVVDPNLLGIIAEYVLSTSDYEVFNLVARGNSQLLVHFEDHDDYLCPYFRKLYSEPAQEARRAIQYVLNLRKPHLDKLAYISIAEKALDDPAYASEVIKALRKSAEYAATILNRVSDAGSMTLPFMLFLKDVIGVLPTSPYKPEAKVTPVVPVSPTWSEDPPVETTKTCLSALWDNPSEIELQPCTFSKTGRNFQKQPVFHCYTCGLSNNTGCCLSCALQCHEGHDIVYAKDTRFYCDCYERESCRYHDQHYDQHPEIGIPGDESMYDRDYLIGHPDLGMRFEGHPRDRPSFRGRGRFTPGPWISDVVGMEDFTFGALDGPRGEFLREMSPEVERLMRGIRRGRPDPVPVTRRPATGSPFFALSRNNESLKRTLQTSIEKQSPISVSCAFSIIKQMQNEAELEKKEVLKSRLTTDIKTCSLAQLGKDETTQALHLESTGRTVACKPADLPPAIGLMSMVCVGGPDRKMIIVVEGSTLSVYQMDTFESVASVPLSMDGVEVCVAPYDPCLVAVASTTRVVVFEISQNRKLIMKYRLDYLLEGPGRALPMIIGIEWVPLERPLLAITTPDCVKLYDLPVDCISPAAYMQSSERIASSAFVVHEGTVYCIIATTGGQLSLQSCSATLNGPVPFSDYFRLPEMQRGQSYISVSTETNMLFVSYATGTTLIYRLDGLFAQDHKCDVSVCNNSGVMRCRLAFQCLYPGIPSMHVFRNMVTGSLQTIEITDNGIASSVIDIPCRLNNGNDDVALSIGCFVQNDTVVALGADGMFYELKPGESHGSLTVKFESIQDTPALNPYSPEEDGFAYKVPPTFWTKLNSDASLASIVTDQEQEGHLAELPFKYVRVTASPATLIITPTDPSRAVAGIVIDCENAREEQVPVKIQIANRVFRNESHMKRIWNLPLKEDEILPGRKVIVQIESSSATISAEFQVFLTDPSPADDTPPVDWMQGVRHVQDFVDSSAGQSEAYTKDSDYIVCALSGADFIPNLEEDKDAVGQLLRLMYRNKGHATAIRRIVLKAYATNPNLQQLWCEAIKDVCESHSADPEMVQLLWRDYTLLDPEYKHQIGDALWKSYGTGGIYGLISAVCA